MHKGVVVTGTDRQINEAMQKLGMELSSMALKSENVSVLAKTDSLRHELDAFYYMNLSHALKR